MHTMHKQIRIEFNSLYMVIVTTSKYTSVGTDSYLSHAQAISNNALVTVYI